MKLSDFLIQATDKLKDAGIESASLDTKLLAGHILRLDRAQLLSQSQRLLSDAELSSLQGLIARRATHESVARIIGKREFWGLDFGINDSTLEPRPDSETVIEAVLAARRHAHRILDLGTGTGCLLLALLSEIGEATGLGIDINLRAVEQAVQNAMALNLHDRAAFQRSDWLGSVEGTFDIIVSNPPYIPASHIEALMPEVVDHDPILALNGGEDGLAPYRHLIPQLAKFLNPGGLVAFEIGQGQSQQVMSFFKQSGFSGIQSHMDLGGIERCITAYIS